MTRKDYVLIIQALRLVKPKRTADPESICQYTLTVRSLATSLNEDNKSFDPARFRRDCGIEYKEPEKGFGYWTVEL